MSKTLNESLAQAKKAISAKRKRFSQEETTSTNEIEKNSETISDQADPELSDSNEQIQENSVEIESEGEEPKEKLHPVVQFFSNLSIPKKLSLIAIIAVSAFYFNVDTTPPKQVETEVDQTITNQVPAQESSFFEDVTYNDINDDRFEKSSIVNSFEPGLVFEERDDLTPHTQELAPDFNAVSPQETKQSVPENMELIIQQPQEAVNETGVVQHVAITDNAIAVSPESSMEMNTFSFPDQIDTGFMQQIEVANETSVDELILPKFEQEMPYVNPQAHKGEDQKILLEKMSEMLALQKNLESEIKQLKETGITKKASVDTSKIYAPNIDLLAVAPPSPYCDDCLAHAIFIYKNDKLQVADGEKFESYTISIQSDRMILKNGNTAFSYWPSK